MITHKTKYALKSLMVLADEKADTGDALRIEDIAERSGAPKRFLEHILLDLKRAGLIGSRRGRNGGYELIKEPRRISIAEVLRLIDGPMAPLPCLSRRAYRRCDDCTDEKTLPGAGRLWRVLRDLYPDDRIPDAGRSATRCRSAGALFRCPARCRRIGFYNHD